MTIDPRLPGRSIASPRGVAEALADLRRDVAMLKAPNQSNVATRMYLNATQAIAANSAGVYVKVNLDGADAGTSGGADTTNHRFVAASTGVYWVALLVRASPVPSDNYIAVIAFKNSTNIATGNGYYGPWGDVGVNGTLGWTAVPMVPGDYLEMVVWHNSTTGWTVLNGSDSTTMIVMKSG